MRTPRTIIADLDAIAIRHAKRCIKCQREYDTVEKIRTSGVRTVGISNITGEEYKIYNILNKISSHAIENTDFDKPSARQSSSLDPDRYVRDKYNLRIK